MKQPMKFSKEVADQLKWYVYRLIDPRNGETFYVGKGKGERVFQHLNQRLDDDAPAEIKEDSETLKYQRIKDIDSAGLEVVVVIHRHGIEVEDVAYQIEAALIDAYPGLTNIQGGKDSGDYGCRGVLEVIAQYQAEEFIPREKILLISIGKSYEIGDRSIYDATRAAWRIDTRKANEYKLVLAHRGGIVVGVFRAEEWVEATAANFPFIGDVPGRSGFVGKEAEPEIVAAYKGKRVPAQYRRKGAASPIRYVDPS